MKKLILPIILVSLVVFIFKANIKRQFFKPNGKVPQSTTQLRFDSKKEVEIIAKDLDIPWEVVFLPSGEMLLTERPGNLILISKTEQKIPISGVVHKGEGGLLGMALHPNFVENSYLYLYLTTRNGEALINRVERYKLKGTTLTDKKVIIENIPGASNHDGGRIAFGLDNYLYIGTGDAATEKLAQNTSSLAGKILRVTDEGQVPPDNPFNNPVYSFGHRNVQGLTWDNSGNLWATEHGPSGNDELNKIEKGKNYGWPDSRGSQILTGTVGPVIESGKEATWAPAGAQYFQDKILFTGLRGEAIYKYALTDKKLEQVFKSEFGRLRTVKLGPDGYFYVLTNNKDGRGSPKSTDDKLLKINPKIFE